MYVYIWTNQAFRARLDRDPMFTNVGGITDEPFVVASEAFHRISESFVRVIGKTRVFDEAVRLACAHCQTEMEDRTFCEDWPPEEGG